MTPAESKVKKSGPGLWPSLIIAGMGVALLSWSLWIGFQSALELLVVDSFDTPGAQSRKLEAGEYEIYGRVATIDIFDFDVEFESATIAVDDLTVTNLRTNELTPVTPAPEFTSLSRNTDAFEVVATFDIDEPGEYTVTVDGAEPSRAVFGRTITSFLDRARGWIALAALGLAMSLLGLIMLIVGLVGRNRARKTPVYAAGPGPGAAPPPPNPNTTSTTTDTPWDS